MSTVNVNWRQANPENTPNFHKNTNAWCIKLRKLLLRGFCMRQVETTTLHPNNEIAVPLALGMLEKRAESWSLLGMTGQLLWRGAERSQVSMSNFQCDLDFQQCGKSQSHRKNVKLDIQIHPHWQLASATAWSASSAGVYFGSWGLHWCMCLSLSLCLSSFSRQLKHITNSLWWGSLIINEMS